MSLLEIRINKIATLWCTHASLMNSPFSEVTLLATKWGLRRVIKATAIVAVAKLSQQLLTARRRLSSPVTSTTGVRGPLDYLNPRPNHRPGNKMWWMAQETTGPLSIQSHHSLVECAYHWQVVVFFFIKIQIHYFETNLELLTYVTQKTLTLDTLTKLRCHEFLISFSFLFINTKWLKVNFKWFITQSG